MKRYFDISYYFYNINSLNKHKDPNMNELTYEKRASSIDPPDQSCTETSIATRNFSTKFQL